MKNLLIIILWILFLWITSNQLHWMVGVLSPLIFVPIGKWSRGVSIALSGCILFIGWFAVIYLKDIQNDSILSTQVGELFQGLSPMMLVLVASIIGGVGGLLAGWFATNVVGSHRVDL